MKPNYRIIDLFLIVCIILLGVIQIGSVNAQVSNSIQHNSTLQDIQIKVDEVVASGFSAPVQVTNAGDGSDRLFVVEQTGKIRIIKNGSVLSTPFLDLTSSIICCGERGLLGLAFHPNYTANGFLYVNYTRSGDGATVIARYTRDAANPDKVNASSPKILLVVPQPYSNHNGGQLLFGKDGFLYIGMGDGGSGGDPQNNSQNIESYLGKLLRLDVDHGDPYAIPTSNPYVGKAGLDEIWALGLRNPWRFSFDRLTGDLYIGDVGQNLWEEVDYQVFTAPGGVNFGWPCREGMHDYDPLRPGCASATLTEPIAEYQHGVGYSITGGFVYRGAAYPALVGRYFYADYSTGKIWSLYKIDQNTWSEPALELQSGFTISSFGEDEDGELYVVNYSQGQIRRLVDANSPVLDLSQSKKSVSTPCADPGETVTYTITISNSGALINAPAALTDQIPVGLSYVNGSLTASHGTVNDTAAPTLTWQGNLNASKIIQISYDVSVTGAVTGSIVNRSKLLVPPTIDMTLATSLTVPRRGVATSSQDFFFPGTQPNSLLANLTPAVDCDTCHSAPIYDRWRGSLMSQAGRDPLMWAALSVANIDAPGSGEYCLRCHTPRGWLNGRAQTADGSSLEALDIHNGVTCTMCHRMVNPVSDPTDETAIIDSNIRSALVDPFPAGFTGSAAAIVDPNDNRRGPFSFGLSLPYHPAFRTSFLGQNQQAITHASMCGTCHNVYNPVLSWNPSRQQFWPNTMNARADSFAKDQLFPVETTYDEWLASDFASGGAVVPYVRSNKPGGVVEACQDCHMPRITGTAVDSAFNPVFRDCETNGCLPEHTFVGANTWTPQLLQNPDWRLNAQSESGYLNTTLLAAKSMLTNAADLELTVTEEGSNKIAVIRVINQTGHKLPTGYAEGRRMWLSVKAYDSAGNLIYESGGYDPGSGELTIDADTKVYEIKQGLTPELASELELPSGESFHFVLNNTVVKDNRIPPRGVTQQEFNRPGLEPVDAVYESGQYWDDASYNLPLETASVLVILYYQTASKEYIDFLRSQGGVDGLTLGGLWDESKSPPQVMAVAFDPAYPIYMPMVNR